MFSPAVQTATDYIAQLLHNVGGHIILGPDVLGGHVVLGPHHCNNYNLIKHAYKVQAIHHRGITIV